MHYTHHIFCCTNKRPDGAARECCANKGAEALRAYMKQRVKDLEIENVRVNVSGCLDRCEEGPVMVVYPEGVWYRCDSKAAIDRVITEHVQGGRVVGEFRI
jgi:(2Fe-2S) ferredoxin